MHKPIPPLQGDNLVRLYIFLKRHHKNLISYSQDGYDEWLGYDFNVNKIISVSRFPEKILKKYSPHNMFKSERYESYLVTLLMTWIFVNKEIIDLRLAMINL